MSSISNREVQKQRLIRKTKDLYDYEAKMDLRLAQTSQMQPQQHTERPKFFSQLNSKRGGAYSRPASVMDGPASTRGAGAYVILPSNAVKNPPQRVVGRLRSTMDSPDGGISRFENSID